MEIKTQFDKAIVSNLDGHWQTVTDIDFGGLSVEFEDFAGNLRNNTTITSMKNGVLANQSASHLFEGYTNLSDFGLDLVDVTNCTWMFGGCESLHSQDLVLNAATNTSYMFDGCKTIGWMEVSMPHVTDASYMFSRCENLYDFSGNCQSVTNFEGMFRLCTRLTDVEMVTSNSGLTADDIAIYPDAPCRAHRYVDDLGGGLFNVTFTARAPD